MKVWITDRWWGEDPTTHKKTRKKSDFGAGSRWQVSYYEEKNDGTRAIVSRKFAKLADAEAFRTRTEHQLREGSYLSQESLNRTLLDAANAWLASKKKPSGASLHKYRNGLEIWVLPAWGRRKLSTIQRTEIDLWLTSLADGTAPRDVTRRVKRGGMSPGGIAGVWVPFQASLAYAVELGWISKNPARGVELPKVRPTERVFLDYVEVERLVNAARSIRGQLSDAVMVELMAYSGLRPGEAVALQIQHVDLKRRRIRIRRTVTIDINGTPTFGEPKHGERREVPIAPHLLDDLAQLMQGKEASAPLLESVRGHFINIHNWRGRVWNTAVDSAGLDREVLTPKALRHTAASMAIAAGADVKVVQSMLGHADASMTLNTYADLWPDRLDEVTDAVSARRSEALGLQSS